MRSLLVVPALLLTACVTGLNSNVPVQQAYVLRPRVAAPAAVAASDPQATSVATAVSTVQVLRPIASAGLGGDGIAVLRAGQRLDYYSGARWASPAPSLLQTLVIDALRAGGKFSMVEADTGPFAAEYVLSLELQHFEAEYYEAGPPMVHVALVCTLGRRGDRNVITSFTAQSEIKADADRMQSVVAAFERASGDALAQAVASIGTH